MESSHSEISMDIIINLVNKMVKSFLSETSTTTFNKHNAQNLYLMCLYGRVFELGVSALNLMKINDYTGVPVVLRSQLEAFVDFANLIADKEFAKIIGANFVAQKKRLYKNFGKDLERSELPPYSDDGTERAVKGIKPQSISERFENVSLKKAHISAYFILCGYSHNDLAMLENRHIERSDNDYKIVFFKEEPLLNCLRFGVTLGLTLVDTHKMLMEFFGKTLDDDTSEICQMFIQLIEKAMALFKSNE
jgi:hypothetical protein